MPLLARFGTRLSRSAPRLAAFAFGIALPLALAALAGTAQHGGLSDHPAAPISIYPL